MRLLPTMPARDSLHVTKGIVRAQIFVADQSLSLRLHTGFCSRYKSRTTEEQSISSLSLVTAPDIVSRGPPRYMQWKIILDFH